MIMMMMMMMMMMNPENHQLVLHSSKACLFTLQGSWLVYLNSSQPCCQWLVSPRWPSPSRATRVLVRMNTLLSFEQTKRQVTSACATDVWDTKKSLTVTLAASWISKVEWWSLFFCWFGWGIFLCIFSLDEKRSLAAEYVMIFGPCCSGSFHRNCLHVWILSVCDLGRCLCWRTFSPGYFTWPFGAPKDRWMERFCRI